MVRRLEPLTVARSEWAKVHHTVTKRPEDGINRRGFLLTVAAAGGAITFTTVGEAFLPLAQPAVLAPRRPGVGGRNLVIVLAVIAVIAVLWSLYRKRSDGSH